MMATHSEHITPQFVSSALDLQEKVRVWAGRAVQNGFSEDAGAGNRIVLRRRPKQGYIVVVVAPIIGYFYGGFMYGGQAAIIYAMIFAVLGLCGIPLMKPTVIETYWSTDAPFTVTVEASGDRRDFKNAVNDLKYILSTNPGTSIQ
jgi:hypothetical protein